MTGLVLSKRFISSLIVLPICIVALATPARADLFGVGAITNNSGVSSQMAQQLSVDVTGLQDNQVLFTFYNDGPIEPYDVADPLDGIITGVYFDDGDPATLLSLATVVNGTGVDFVDGRTKGGNGTLAGASGLDPKFETTADFWAVKSNDVHYGVDPGEHVGVVFELQDQLTAADVINAINLGFGDVWDQGALRIAMRVQNLGPGGEFSDSFTLVPTPGAVILAAIGLGIAGLKLRRFA